MRAFACPSSASLWPLVRELVGVGGGGVWRRICLAPSWRVWPNTPGARGLFYSDMTRPTGIRFGVSLRGVLTSTSVGVSSHAFCTSQVSCDVPFARRTCKRHIGVHVRMQVRTYGVHVRTCTHFFLISGTDRRVVLEFGVK